MEFKWNELFYVVVSFLLIEVFKVEIFFKGIFVLGGRLYKLNFMVFFLF